MIAKICDTMYTLHRSLEIHSRLKQLDEFKKKYDERRKTKVHWKVLSFRRGDKLRGYDRFYASTKVDEYEER